MATSETVMKELEGIQFPATKQDIISYARNREAPADILDALHEIPDMDYQSMENIWEALGTVF